MASRANWGALALNLFGSAGKGYLEAKQRDEETKRAAAAALLAKQKEENDNDIKNREFQLNVEKAKAGSTVIGPDGKPYQAAGISPEAADRLTLPGMMGPLNKPQVSTGLPGAIQVGPGKVSVVKPNNAPVPKTKRINVPQSEYDAHPDLYSEAPEGHEYHIVPAAKKSLSPEQQTAMFVTKELYKDYLHNGTLSEDKATQLKDASAHLDISMFPEEEQGILYGVQKYITGTEFHPKIDTNTKKSLDFKSEAEVEAAKLPSGTVVTINGRKARVK